MSMPEETLPDALRFSSSWSLGEDAYQAISKEMLSRNARCIVEFGSGTSTVRFSRDLDATIVSIESDIQYLEQTRSELRSHGNEDKVSLRHRPIRWQRHALCFFRSFEPSDFPMESMRF